MLDVNSDIDKIILHFKLSNRQYILFSLISDTETYLYLKNEKETIISLLYGKEIYPKIQSLLKENSTNCIECELGMLIEGGVSYDSPDFVEFNLSKSRANQIIEDLKINTEIIDKKIEVVSFK
ncbi:MAG: hypothetical protein ACTSQ5_05385 [Promethearchaeota archaeon]